LIIIYKLSFAFDANIILFAFFVTIFIDMS